MKLVSDIKQFLILNDFLHVNEAIKAQNLRYRHTQSSVDMQLLALRDDMMVDLFELEEEYYSSQYKWSLYILNSFSIATVAASGHRLFKCIGH